MSHKPILLVKSSPQQCLALHHPSAARGDSCPFPGPAALSCLIDTKIPPFLTVSVQQTISFRLRILFSLIPNKSPFLSFPHLNTFTKVLPLSPGLSSGTALPANSGARFLCSGGCSLLSVCIIDPLTADLLQSCLMAIFFSPSWTFFGRFAVLFLGFSALAVLHCKSLAGEYSQEFFTSGDQTGKPL